MLENAISSINHESVIEGLKSRGISYSIDSSTNLMKKLINWLNSLKDRIQPQPEQGWSEADEHWRQKAVDFIKHPDLIRATPVLAEDTIKWLKSLRPQNTWKPSDEQMEYLSAAIEESNENPVLESLYQDLKKLKC